MIKTALAALLFPLSLMVRAEDAELAKLFASRGITGTVVIQSLDGKKTFIHDDRRAHRRLSPASTFKIPNTLIAIDEKAIADGELFKWDGQPKEFPDWNRDHTLESAFKTSCIWCYQEIARRIGAKIYADMLHRCGYGELTRPFDTTNFWLDGALKISAVEQVEFLKQVYLHTLPFSAKAYDTLRKIMVTEETLTYSLRTKTGWSTRILPQTGWYVGYVEKPGAVWLFAMNIELRNDKDLALRQQITREALRTKGIME